ncbi:MAG: hypothetical protein AB7I59_26075 [Geminicoccaceae bacterium]
MRETEGRQLRSPVDRRVEDRMARKLEPDAKAPHKPEALHKS